MFFQSLLRRSLTLCSAALLLLGSAGCKAAHYEAMELFGVHKRDILVDRVEAGREEQADAKEQFQTTFEAFKAITGFEGGDIEKQYKKLNKEYERCEDAAEEVRERIDSIESVSTDLFKEWRSEIEEISSPDLRRDSERLLRETEVSSEGLISTMNAASERMDPVLTAFKDQVLFLKHNLNAQAIASLENNVIAIESDISRLITEMQASIDEADAFIASMGS